MIGFLNGSLSHFGQIAPRNIRKCSVQIFRFLFPPRSITIKAGADFFFAISPQSLSLSTVPNQKKFLRAKRLFFFAQKILEIFSPHPTPATNASPSFPMPSLKPQCPPCLEQLITHAKRTFAGGPCPCGPRGGTWPGPSAKGTFPCNGQPYPTPCNGNQQHAREHRDDHAAGLHA